VVHVWDCTLQHVPAVQSPSLQQALCGRQAPLQHCAPEPHCALLVHPQLAALHVCVALSQQVPAVQSPFVQHAAHAPLQQTWPPLHCALLVQPQLAALHMCVALSQQVPAVQSLVAQHWPGTQTGPVGAVASRAASMPPASRAAPAPSEVTPASAPGAADVELLQPASKMAASASTPRPELATSSGPHPTLETLS
jgi:hypothetical protein